MQIVWNNKTLQRGFPIGWEGLAGFVESGKQPIAKESLATGLFAALNKTRSSYRQKHMFQCKQTPLANKKPP